MRSCVNDRGCLIKAENLNDCRKTKLTVRQMLQAGLFVGADFSLAVSVYNTQNDLSELWAK